MNKILYIDDDRVIDKPKLEIDHRCTLKEAYKAFGDEFVYDIVSLDGHMPFEMDRDDEYEAFVYKHTRIINLGKSSYTQYRASYARTLAGVYLLYLMKKFNYVPKIVIFHSFDYHVRVIMEDIFKNMFYDQAVVMMFMDKRYIFDKESVALIPQAIEKQKTYFTNHESEKVYIKLAKGKNSFIVTPDTTIFFKKDIEQTSVDTINTHEFVMKKVSEGYDIVHGEEYIVDASYIRGRDRTDFYGNMNFKVSPIHF